LILKANGFATVAEHKMNWKANCKTIPSSNCLSKEKVMAFDVIVRSRKRAPAVVVELEDPRAVKRYANERMDNLLRTPRADPSPGESYRPRSPPAA
jgi:hypothetical protein